MAERNAMKPRKCDHCGKTDPQTAKQLKMHAYLCARGWVLGMDPKFNLVKRIGAHGSDA